MSKNLTGNNREFFESLAINNLTFLDYKNRFEKIALSMFEWVNLPDTMDARFLEKSLYLYGMCAIFKDNEYGFINTNCNKAGKLNIYGLPTTINCSAINFHKNKRLYTGINNNINNEELEKLKNNQAILVMNDWNCLPTSATLNLFAYRLYECDRSCDVNIKLTKNPIVFRTTEKLKNSMTNFWNKVNGNQPFILAEKGTFNMDDVQVFKTDAPFYADKITEYKKSIWNEALTFLGVNNLAEEKKERLIVSETSSNNELINLNLQSYLLPRKKACEQFNEFYNLPDDKKIDVKVRSDLFNTIKNEYNSFNNDNINKDLFIESEE